MFGFRNKPRRKSQKLGFVTGFSHFEIAPFAPYFGVPSHDICHARSVMNGTGAAIDGPR
jgi:hypothetical protein